MALVITSAGFAFSFYFFQKKVFLFSLLTQYIFGLPEVCVFTCLSAKMHLPRSGQVPRRAKRGAFAQRKSQEGARYNSAASRDREEPPLIHRSSQSPISKGEHGAPACAPYGFSLRSKVPSESFAFCGASQQHPPRYEQSRQEMKNNKIVVISVIQNIMWVDMIQKINRFS